MKIKSGGKVRKNTVILSVIIKSNQKPDYLSR